jgi:hypothetical protein
MKKIISLFVLFSIFSACKTNEIIVKQTVTKNNSTQTEQMNIIEKTEIIPHQSIAIQQDEAGAKYVKTLQGNKTLFKYIYKTSFRDKTIMDGGYAQYVYFETPEKVKSMKLTDNELKTVNLTVATYGFRNAQLWQIDKGSLDLKVIDKNTIQFHLQIDSSFTGIQKRNLIQIIKINTHE